MSFVQIKAAPYLERAFPSSTVASDLHGVVLIVPFARRPHHRNHTPQNLDVCNRNVDTHRPFHDSVFAPKLDCWFWFGTDLCTALESQRCLITPRLHLNDTNRCVDSICTQPTRFPHRRGGFNANKRLLYEQGTGASI